jgi:hypothetical protein
LVGDLFRFIASAGPPSDDITLPPRLTPLAWRTKQLIASLVRAGKTYDAFSILFLMAKAGEVQTLLQTIENILTSRCGCL